MAHKTYVKDGGAWKEPIKISIKDGIAGSTPVWKEIIKGYVKDGGSWKLFWVRKFTYNITVDTNQVDLNDVLTADNKLGDVDVIIHSGVYVYSNNTGIPAFKTGTGYGGLLQIINNGGHIVGAGGTGGSGGTSSGSGGSGGNGGNGGTALYVEEDFTYDPTSAATILGGGGGGGGGGGANDPDFLSGTEIAAGGGGGGGASYGSGGATDGEAGAKAGSKGGVSSGGSGGVGGFDDEGSYFSSGNARGGSGGAGGNAGQAGNYGQTALEGSFKGEGGGNGSAGTDIVLNGKTMTTI